MNPQIKFYGGLVLFVLLTIALVAAVVQLVRDLRRATLWDTIEAETQAKDAAAQVSNLIHKRKGFFAVSARISDGRLIEIKKCGAIEEARQFIEQNGIDRIYAIAEQMAPVRNKKPPRISQKEVRRQQMIEAQMKLRNDLLLRQ